MSSRSAIKTAPLASREAAGRIQCGTGNLQAICVKGYFTFLTFYFANDVYYKNIVEVPQKFRQALLKKNSNEIILVYFCESNNLNNQIGLLFCNKCVIIIQHIFLYEW